MGSSNENSAYGPVKNPVATDRFPAVERRVGGSGGGRAGGGWRWGRIRAVSIRQPGSFCGIPAMIGSYGRVSRYGLIAFRVLARSNWAVCEQREGCSGHFAGDRGAGTRTIQPRRPLRYPTIRDEIVKPVKGLRLGIPKEVFRREEWMPGFEEGRSGPSKSIRSSAVNSSRFEMPHTDYAIAAYYIIATAEASSNLARY